MLLDTRQLHVQMQVERTQLSNLFIFFSCPETLMFLNYHAI